MSVPGTRNGRLLIKDVELEVFHKGGGPALLLLHGGNGLDHRAKFLELLAERFEVIAPSHPGFGRTPLPDRFDSVDDLAYLYLDLLDACGLRDVVLVGPVEIKISDRETRDIPDIFATSPDDLVWLVFHDPRNGVVDYGVLSG